MYKVKLSIAKDNAGCARQTPKGEAVWGNYKFFINQEIEEADFWVVYSKGERKTETCKTPVINTLFITGEPETIYHYSKGFVEQFNRVVVCQDKISHNNLLKGQPAQPWHVGKVNIDDKVTFTKNYDQLKESPLNKKEKLISVITSNKAFTKGHQKRIDFVLKLKKHFGDKIDLFGRGFNEIDDKWDVIAPYKYHIAIENSCFDDYWTEKLADTYLGGAYPFYYGCSNLDEYFDKKSYSLIDIDNFPKSVKIIEETLQNNTYEKNIDNIRIAKDLILDKYNLFQVIAEQLDKMDPNAKKEDITLKHDMEFFDVNKITKMAIPRFINKFRMKLK